MPKKLFSLLFCAALVLSGMTCFAAAPGKDLLDLTSLSPDTIGLRISSELVNNADPSVKFETKWPVAICLAQKDIRDKHADQTMLTFSADLKGEKLDGTAYLEMYIHVPGGAGGTFVASGTARVLTAAEPGWSRFQAEYALSAGQVPDLVTLNLVINGKGTVWMKGAKLQRVP